MKHEERHDILQQLVILTGKIMSEEELYERLKEHLDEFLITKSKEAKAMVRMDMMMLIVNQIEGSPNDLINQMNQFHQIKEQIENAKHQ